MRESVKEFAEMIEKILQKNDSKGGWEECTNLYLATRLVEEVGEVMQKLNAGERGAMSLEVIDVANFAMMLYDNNADQIKKLDLNKFM